MKVYYDDEVDALYLKLSDETPEGVIEIDEGINIDTTCDNRIVGIEILNASKRMDLKTVLSYSVEFEKELMIQEAAQQIHCEGLCDAAAEFKVRDFKFVQVLTLNSQTLNVELF